MKPVSKIEKSKSDHALGKHYIHANPLKQRCNPGLVSRFLMYMQPKKEPLKDRHAANMLVPGPKPVSVTDDDWSLTPRN